MRVFPGSRLLCVAAMLGGLAAPAVQAADFTTTAGYAATCADRALRQGVPKTDEERIAAVICRDTALVQQIVTWASRGMKRVGNERTPHSDIEAEVTREIDYAIAEIGATRKLLAQIQLGKRKSLQLTPAQWQLDIDSDGRVDMWEKYLFAIPKRGKQAFRFSAPSNDPEYYDREYNLGATIRVDQSDILWSLSYHHFIEGLLTNVRAFDLDKGFKGVVVARPHLLKAAHKLIGNGFVLSNKMRQSVLAETDDDQEFIGNPKQASSVFPIPLDHADFAMWGGLIKEMNALWQGRTLLPTTAGGRGLLAEFAPVCPAGSGLNIAKVYLEPPAAGTFITFENTKLPTHQCQRINKAHPVSRLPEMAEQAQKSDSGMGFMRYFYWTN